MVDASTFLFNEGVIKRIQAKKKMKAPSKKNSESPSRIEPSHGQRDHESSDEEDEEDYRKGGYHPVKVGEKFKMGEYEIVGKLGWGHFSTVWMAKRLEMQANSHTWDSFVALKVVKSDRKYIETAMDEIKLLNASQNPRKKDNLEGNSIVRLLDSFRHEGPNGNHVCMAFELMGCNLLKLIKKFDYKGMPVKMVKRIAFQVLNSLRQLHSAGIIHTDLKPENVLIDFVAICGARKEDGDFNLDALSLSAPQSLVSQFKALFSFVNEDNIKVKLADLGNACWTDHHFTEDIQTRQYRSPEVLIGASYNETTDLWSFSCMIFELLTGDFLFDPHEGDYYSRDEDHMAQILELVGPKFPKHLLEKGKYSSELFNKRAELRHISSLEFWPLYNVLHEKYKFGADESREMAEFMEMGLELNWKRRVSASEMLESKWLDEVRNAQ